MPISTNAPFNEFGFSMVQRDLEQLYLALGGAGTGSSGDGSTQDQNVVNSQGSGTSGGTPNLSRLATQDYVDAAIDDLWDTIPSISYPIAVNKGGTGATDASTARSNLGIPGLTTTLPTEVTPFPPGYMDVDGYSGSGDRWALRVDGTVRLTFGERSTSPYPLGWTANSFTATYMLATNASFTNLDIGSSLDISNGLETGSGPGIDAVISIEDNGGTTHDMEFANGVLISYSTS